MELKHKNFEAIILIIHKIMMDKQCSDKVFEGYFKTNKSITSSDKAFIVQYVYHMIRHWRLFSEINKNLTFHKQNEIIDIFGISWLLSGYPISSKDPFKAIPKNDVIKLYTGLKTNRAIFHSLPDWLDEIGNRALGDKWTTILSSLNNAPHLVLRTNTLKISKDKLRLQLKAKGIKTDTHSEAPDALILKDKINIFQLPEFKDGLFEMQDISSQITGHFAGPAPGMRIVDGCAGNGGKTLHLANLMKNKGKIVALDIYPSKLETLKKRAKRAGISIIEPRPIDSTKIIKRLYGSADLVLLDVPCSGLGVLKRNPEIKWRLQPSDLDNLQKTQEDILNRYSFMVKPGGKLVYSTCSILPQENSEQIHKFLEKQPLFELISERFISPEQGFDGFYMASLKRLP